MSDDNKPAEEQGGSAGIGMAETPPSITPPHITFEREVLEKLEQIIEMIKRIPVPHAEA